MVAPRLATGNAVQMIGFVVRHRQLGLGKILSTQNRAFAIRFLDSDQVFNLGFAELHNGSLAREVLGSGSTAGHFGKSSGVGMLSSQ